MEQPTSWHKIFDADTREAKEEAQQSQHPYIDRIRTNCVPLLAPDDDKAKRELTRKEREDKFDQCVGKEKRKIAISYGKKESSAWTTCHDKVMFIMDEKHRTKSLMDVYAQEVKNKEFNQEFYDLLRTEASKVEPMSEYLRKQQTLTPLPKKPAPKKAPEKLSTEDFIEVARPSVKQEPVVLKKPKSIPKKVPKSFEQKLLTPAEAKERIKKMKRKRGIDL